MKRAPTLYDAVAGLLGPLAAEYARIIDEMHPTSPVEINIGGYVHKTTLSVIQDLDRAYAQAFETKCKRRERRSRGTLL